MVVFSIIIEVTLFVLLVVLGSIKIRHPNISSFEIERLKKSNKDDDKILILYNYQFFNSAVGLAYVAIVISFTALMLYLLPALQAYMATLALVYISYLLSKINFIRLVSVSLTRKLQNKMLKSMNDKHHILNYFLPQPDGSFKIDISSADELQNIINSGAEFLTTKQKNLIRNGLGFTETPVKDVMIKRPDLSTVKGTEVLGPLVLDKLYNSKQEYVLVIGKNVDEVKGTLALKDQLTVEADSKTTQTAIKAASKPPHYIKQDEMLEKALECMSENNTNVLIVIDENKKTMGIITLWMIVNFLTD